jgi:signal peptidase I
MDNLLGSNFYKFEYLPFDNVSISLGLRYEYSSVIKDYNIAPRFYASYKFKGNHILSFTAGTYYQNPANDYLILNKDLDFTKSDNVTLSYAYAKKQSKLQIDTYYKLYGDLITYKEGEMYYENIGNNGYGYAYGVDFFWKGYVKMLEYWVSYSYIDSKRKYQAYVNERMPDMISNNLLKFDLKYWYNPIRTMISVGYYIDSGSYGEVKIYGEKVIMKTPYRNSLTLNLSYLPFNNMVIHLACQNILGFNNIYGYTGSSFSEKYKPITALSKQFFYLGVFLTLSPSKNKNQLENL